MLVVLLVDVVVDVVVDVEPYEDMEIVLSEIIAELCLLVELVLDELVDVEVPTRTPSIHVYRSSLSSILLSLDELVLELVVVCVVDVVELVEDDEAARHVCSVNPARHKRLRT